jgi:type II secretory pathway pseudopilin PulG
MGEGSREGVGLTGGLTTLRAGPPATMHLIDDRGWWRTALSRAHRHRLRSARGTSLLDLLAALTVVGLASGIAFASVERNVTTARETGAARAFTMRVRQVRLEAIRRSAHVGLLFAAPSTAPSSASSFRAYVDGNGNGVRTRDIASGIDPPMGAVAALEDGLGGVQFARAPDVPGAGDDDDDGGSGGDAIRLGASGLLSFAPTGSGTSGTIYLRGPTRQFAVRIYGPTGRIRLMEFDWRTRTWSQR